jgi:hypothetical protein
MKWTQNRLQFDIKRPRRMPERILNEPWPLLILSQSFSHRENVFFWKRKVTKTRRFIDTPGMHFLHCQALKSALNSSFLISLLVLTNIILRQNAYFQPERDGGRHWLLREYRYMQKSSLLLGMAIEAYRKKVNEPRHYFWGNGNSSLSALSLIRFI